LKNSISVIFTITFLIPFIAVTNIVFLIISNELATRAALIIQADYWEYS